MAGFFGLFDFTREGPGVRKDEPDKGPVLGTLEILTRRFWELIKLNLMMLVFNLPALIVAFFLAIYLLAALFPGLSVATLIESFQALGLEGTAEQSLEAAAVSQLTVFYLITAFALAGLQLVAAGPFQAGFAFILRNYIRDEHVFTWSDFREHARDNWRQSLLASLISVAALIVLVINLTFYRTADFLPASARMAIQILLSAAGLVWLLMQIYVYPMIVTFKLTLGQIYRNSLLFVILRLPSNLLYLLIAAVLLLVVPGALLMNGSVAMILIAAVWYLVLALAVNQFIAMAIAWRGIRRFMLKDHDEHPA
ncbi:MAG: DUF624 domain-containing protein [Eubacteriales bacterium]|nr:DUF624 domain-containing protein [Eubacteriales bacterium]